MNLSNAKLLYLTFTMLITAIITYKFNTFLFSQFLTLNICFYTIDNDRNIN